MSCNNRRLAFGVIPAVLAISVLCAAAASPGYSCRDVPLPNPRYRSEK